MVSFAVAPPVVKFVEETLTVHPVSNPPRRSEIDTDEPDYFRGARAMFAGGFRPGDVVYNTFSYHLVPAGIMMESALKALGCVQE